jgi:PTH1 family peptidyl-tRNA hydrolase
MSLLNWFYRLFKKEKKESDPMKYLIAGLGNIGGEYENTRHNIGFDVVDVLAKQFDAAFKTETLGDLASFRHKGRTFILLKPSTYMNRSGKAVRYWMQKENIKPENLLVVLDDLQLPFGRMRLRPNGSDGGHNGLKDINQTFGNNNYARLRMGIGDDFHKGQQVNFVLGKWSSEERENLKPFLEKACDCIKSFGTIGMAHTMNTFNTK